MSRGAPDESLEVTAPFWRINRSTEKHMTTKANYTHLEFILDSSGSMEHLARETISGVNSLIAKHREAEGEATIGISNFNYSRWRTRFLTRVKDIMPITPLDYRPAGGTALLDAMATAIDELGKDLLARPERDRPSKVIVVVITDGQENSSFLTAYEDVKTRVEHQTRRYGWEFMFLGANMDAFAEGGKLGISPQTTAFYNATPVGTRDAYDTISSSLMRGRAGGSTHLTNDEREKLADSK